MTNKFLQHVFSALVVVVITFAAIGPRVKILGMDFAGVTAVSAGGNDQCKNEDSNSAACREEEIVEDSDDTEVVVSTNNGLHLGQQTNPEVVLTNPAGVIIPAAGGPPAGVVLPAAANVPTVSAEVVNVAGGDADVDPVPPVVSSDGTVTLPGTSEIIAASTANAAGRNVCDALTDSGFTPAAPTAPMTEQQFAEGPWNLQWKNNATNAGRNRTWPAGGCVWHSQGRDEGGFWAPYNGDVSNGHINDANLENDTPAWPLKLRNPYDRYVEGYVVFVQ